MNIDIYKSHYKQLLYLGIPIMLGQLGIIVLGFADTMMIGHHTTEELAAASFTNNILLWPSYSGPAFRMVLLRSSENFSVEIIRAE